MNSLEGRFTGRALIVDLSMKFGGASARAADLVRTAESLGWALAVLQNSPAREHAHSNGLRCHVVGSNRADPLVITRLAKVIRSGEFEIVDAQNPQSKLWGSLAAWRAGAAYVSTLNSWPLSEYGPSVRGIVYTLLERWTRRITHMSIAVSEDILEHLHRDGVPPSRTCYIPAAIDLDQEALHGDLQTLTPYIDQVHDTIVCTAVGRLADAKGYPTLIDAFRIVVQRFPDIRCLIIGEGPLREALQAKIEDSALHDRIKLLGYKTRAETLRIVAASDLFVMPSLSEGTPIALLEAAALGRPIVASRVGGIPAMLEAGTHARLVQPEDAISLANAIIETLENSTNAMAMAKRAQRHIKGEFSTKRQLEATLRAYQQASLNFQKSNAEDSS